jgi:FeS assembly SUF system protein
MNREARSAKRMGIFSFLTGDNKHQESAGGDRDAARPQSASEAPAGGEAKVAGSPTDPAVEPGAGLADFEPPGRHDAFEPGLDDARRPEPTPPDWWRSAPGAGDPPTGPGPEPSWDLGALLESPTAPSGHQIEIGSPDPKKTLELKPRIVDALSTVFDPEIPVNIYELGLIYDVVIDADARVQIRMTLTSPACPSAQQLPSEVQYKVKAVPGVADAGVEVVWDPPWTKDMMSDAAKLSLGIW